MGDSGSLSVDGARVRLYGIDAPELDQACTRDGVIWKCGEEAKRQLAELAEGKQVESGTIEPDPYGCLVSVCRVGDLELNRTMVEQGWATASQSITSAYVAAETKARVEKRGIWTSEFDLPQYYRAAKREGARPHSRSLQSSNRITAQPPEWKGGCVIKGNRNRKGPWNYHVPGMPYYDATRVEEIFCSEAQAKVAGYRRAIVK